MVTSTTPRGSRKWDQTVVIFTYLLLTFGLCFSICQGVFENFALHDCASLVNTYSEFFFFVGHRTLLLLIFLNRLFAVFNGSAYSYPIAVHYVLSTIIIMYGILAFICHAFNLAIMKVQSNWSLWNGDGFVCGWQFGVLVTHMIRPLDYVLNLIILFLFLYKLYVLHQREKVRRASYVNKLRTIGTSEEHRERRAHNDLEIVARRLTILTFIALFTSILVTGGYLGYHLRIITVLWSWDLAANSFCCILVLTWANFMINPCFGKKCDRFCCIKCVECCECIVVGPCAKNHSDEESRAQSNSFQRSDSLEKHSEITTNTVYEETQATHVEITITTAAGPVSPPSS